MRSHVSLGIIENTDFKSDSGMSNKESIEREVYTKIMEEREYIEDL